MMKCYVSTTFELEAFTHGQTSQTFNFVPNRFFEIKNIVDSRGLANQIHFIT